MNTLDPARAPFYFHRMKPWPLALMIALVAVAGHLIGWPPAFAQSGIDRNAEERYRILNSKFDNLLEAQGEILKNQQELKSRLDALEREIARSKEDNASSSIQYVTREELRAIWEKIDEIERKRDADKKLILDSIRKLEKIPLAAAGEFKAENKSGDSERYKYVVKPDETLFAIIIAYNELFKSQGRGLITQADVEKANPGLKPDFIREGQTIEIPIPPKKR